MELAAVNLRGMNFKQIRQKSRSSSDGEGSFTFARLAGADLALTPDGLAGDVLARLANVAFLARLAGFASLAAFLASLLTTFRVGQHH